MGTGRPAALLAIALILPAPGPRAEAEAPLRTDLEEKIEVRLVTIDVVALDSQERTVADLTQDDLELVVDGETRAIDTWDAFCDNGSESDPNSRRFGEWVTPKNLTEGTRRIVLAFDYLHLPTAPCPDMDGPCLFHTKSLQDFQRTLESKTGIADEELMVVALTGGLRVEQPFTKDRAAVLATLRRMEHDISLWNGNFGHLTETPLFTSLRALVTVLRATPGAKSVVFVSVGPGPGNRYSLEFDELAAAASDAGVSFYSVDCNGVYAKSRFT